MIQYKEEFKIGIQEGFNEGLSSNRVIEPFLDGSTWLISPKNKNMGGFTDLSGGSKYDVSIGWAYMVHFTN